MTNEITYKPIGIVHSPFKEPKNVPIQASASKDAVGTIEIYPEYAEGLKDLECFSHVILLYHFHLITNTALLVKPFLDDKMHGIFATRAPARPNRIGLSILEIKSVKGNIIEAQGVDVLNGTPVLDVKPYVPKFDHRENCQIGWYTNKIDKLSTTKDDGRFCK